MYLSLEDYRRRMLGCWIGKNVGGTLGMPMEWNRQPNDVGIVGHIVGPVSYTHLTLPTIA